MFDVVCPGHGRRVLLGPHRIEAVVNTPEGIVVHWRCTCGARGRLLTGAAARRQPRTLDRSPVTPSAA